MSPPSRAACFEPLEGRVHFAADPPTILFVRGAPRSGGFLEGVGAVPRNGQLADINDHSTANSNTGWGTLADALRDKGFVVEQMSEPKGANAPPSGFVDGRPIRFEDMDLSRYSAIVFGSNNARYPRETVDAIERYIRGGGGAMFISDANFGSTWNDAPDSDQPFLGRFGLTVNQDNGVYPLTRAGGDFAAADHPVLDGVDSFDGEGVSPITVPAAAPAGVTITRVAGVRDRFRRNDGTSEELRFRGSLRPVTDREAALVLANVGAGRVAAYFDRNTFFNANGIGTDMTRLDNRQFALNLFGWVADDVPPRVAGASFVQGSPSVLGLTFDDTLFGSLTRRDVLLSDRTSGEAIPRDRWSFGVSESAEETELVVRIKGAQPAGKYQLRINPGGFADASGNVSVDPVRFNFTLAATAPIQSLIEKRGVPPWRVFDDVFGVESVT